MGSLRQFFTLLLFNLGLVGCKPTPEGNPPAGPDRTTSVLTTTKPQQKLSDRLEPTPYQNREYKFSMHMPKGFKPVDFTKPGMVVMYKEEISGTNINIRCPAVPPGTTLDALYGDIRSRLPTSLQEVKDVKEGELQIDGHRVKWLDMSHTKLDQRVRQNTYILVKNTSAYMIFCSTTEASFDTYRSLFQEAVETLRIE